VGRSNRAQAETNRQRIVDVADAAFRKSGTQAVTIAEVMTQAVADCFSEKPPEKTCPMVALARDAEPHQASQALNARRNADPGRPRRSVSRDAAPTTLIFC
jgi:F420-dependent methylenetetrahydromethanopterin dehydrogenase